MLDPQQTSVADPGERAATPLPQPPSVEEEEAQGAAEAKAIAKAIAKGAIAKAIAAAPPAEQFMGQRSALGSMFEPAA